MALPAPTTPELKSSLGRVLGTWERRASEKAAASDASHDAQVRKSIEAAIDLQRKDPDLNSHDQDRMVLDLLNEALRAQLRDEATDTPNSGNGGMY